MRHLIYFFVALVIGTHPARAAWHEASGEHFIIYADQKASVVQRFAERLERYHAAMAFMLIREPESPSPSNRVTVFVVSNQKNVRKLADIKSKYVAGVYRPFAGNIVAIVPMLRRAGSKFALNPETILRHEYAHHYMFNISSNVFPLWFQEGFAEFYASGREERDGTVILGGAANHRAYELALSRSVPIKALLDTKAYLQNKSSSHDQFYGRSWMLYHYLTFHPKRKGQLVRYQNLLTSGTNELEAAKRAFGDLKKLNSDLRIYAKKKRLTAFGIPPDRLKISPVRVRRLNDGEAEMMPMIMESRTGVDDQEAQEVVVEARRIAAKHPNNAAVLEALAEAEFDAGYDDRAIAAATSALSLDSKRVRAQIQKIYAYARKAETAENEEQVWKEVRKQIVAANRIENDHPIPLIQYYRSYRNTGKRPPDIAIQGLQRAMQIAPFDQGLRLMVAQQYMQDGEFDFAAAVLRPVAHNPHRSSTSEAAEKLLEIAEMEAQKVTDDTRSNSASEASETK